MKERPGLLISMIGRQLRLLLVARHALDAGLSSGKRQLVRYSSLSSGQMRATGSTLTIPIKCCLVELLRPMKY